MKALSFFSFKERGRNWSQEHMFAMISEPYQPRLSIRSDAGRPLTIRAFAEAADTSPRRIRRLIRQGRLTTTENQAGEIRVPEAQLEKVLAWRERRALSQSMEMPAVSMELERTPLREQSNREAYTMQVPLERHEAAMMRLGYLESELATCKQQLHEASMRELETREKSALQGAELEALKAATAQIASQLEEVRSQNVDSTFRTLELQDEVKSLRSRLTLNWWGRFMEALRTTKPDAPIQTHLKPPPPGTTK